MVELIPIKDLEQKNPLFREFCKINGLKDGDCYKAIDYIFWCDNLTMQESIDITRKYIENFKRKDFNY